MSLRNTLFMALVLTIVGAFIYFVELPEQQRKAESELVLRRTSIQAFERIELQNPKGTFVLENTAPRADANEAQPEDRLDRHRSWRMRGIDGGALDKIAFTSLAGALETLKAGSTIDSADVAPDPAVYGLQNPEARIVAVAPGKRIEIALGKKNDFVGQRYARVVDDQGPPLLGLFNESLYNAAVKARDDYRDRNPIDFVDHQIQSIDVTWRREHSVIDSAGVGTWKLREPYQAPASPASVSGFLRELRGLRVAEFIDGAEDLKKYRLDKPDARVKITFKPDTRAPLEIVASAAPKNKEIIPTYYKVEGLNTVFKSEASSLNGIMKGPDLFRERRLFSFDADDVTELRYESGQKKITISKDGPAWKVGDREADPVFARQYLIDLGAIEALDFPKMNADFGFDKPFATISVSLKEPDAQKALTRSLVIGSPVKGPNGSKARFAAADDRSTPFILSEEAVHKSVPKEDALLKTAGGESEQSKSQPDPGANPEG